MAPPVLFVSYSGLLGGGERILLDCATRLERPAWLACPEGPLAAAARAGGLRVAPVAGRPLRLRGGPRRAATHALGLAGLARDVAGLVRGARPAAVVAWSLRATLAVAAVPSRTPWVAVHNDFVPPGAVGVAVRAATRRADAVAALSSAIAAGVGRPAAILRPGVDLDAWRLDPPPPGPPRALVLGALAPWKRPGLALDVADRVPGLRLDLAGAPLPGDDPAFAEALRARATALGPRVRLLGHVDARAALGEASVLLHAADEPYGLALVEALAAGRPVVAPDAGGAREIVPAAWRYRLGDAGHAAAVLGATLADPEAPARATRRARDFDVRAGAARFAAVLDGVVARA